ncbi:hypothetical protein NLG97_g11141 [Lecanicillium saksenae]|uniref:Uncharacterized protein n=1 Tax=Lecanicillium saksenae TaxID=468837 RepID=A0ACC1QDY9_9HYPO|nr:hypothetical protein NLG97_g11141 [Lecanicillium saksenae]
MFARFFSGGGGFGGFGGGGVFDTGPQFVFNFGGGPGFRVHQFGGARPRGRPRDTQNRPEEAQSSGIQNLIGILPILLFFIFPLLTSLFGGDDGPSIPSMVFDKAQPPHTKEFLTPEHKIKYFVRPQDVHGYTDAQKANLGKIAERQAFDYIERLCLNEEAAQRRMREEAMGWFYQDEGRMRLANGMPKPNCGRLSSLLVKKKDKKDKKEKQA